MRPLGTLRLRAYLGTGKTGKLIFDKPGHSILGNFLLPWLAQLIGGATTGSTFTDIDGNSFNATCYIANFNTPGPVTNANLGLIVGRAATPVTLADYKLSQPITHGSGLNQLLYGLQVYGVVGKAPSLWALATQRAYVNNSGNTIVVLECGLYGYVYASTASLKTVCLARDIHAAISVPNGKTLTMEYLIGVPLL